jgi:hypothetical protein
MTTTRFITVLTAWLGIGLIAHGAGLIEEGTWAWSLLFGLPGAIYAMVLFGGAAFAALMVFIALLAPAARR